MKRTTIGTIALAGLFASSAVALAQSAKGLVGTWKNAANVQVGADGKRTDTFGPHGTGMAIFGADGHFVIVNIDPDTPKVAANSRVKGTPAENKAMVEGGIGLYGTYTVANKVITFKVDGSTYPNWTGTDQKRDVVKFAKDEFTWGLTSSMGSKGEVTWKRIK
jgi:hypothetical protein